MNGQKADVLAVPALFYDDHASRALPTPAAIRRAGRMVYIRTDDVAIEDLRLDALYYADKASMDECPRSIVRSAARTVATLARYGAQEK